MVAGNEDVPVSGSVPRSTYQPTPVASGPTGPRLIADIAADLDIAHAHAADARRSIERLEKELDEAMKARRKAAR